MSGCSWNALAFSNAYRERSMDEYEMVNETVKRLFNDKELSQPVYFPEIRTEAQAEAMADELPLIYVWNEDPTRGSCSISVNGAVVAAALTDLLPRTHPRFAAVRDHILAVFKEVAVASVLKTCETLQALPSQVFSREMYSGR